jgi:hypothetical protein
MWFGRAFSDPDTRLLRWGWLAFATWTLIGGAQLIRALRAGEEAMVGVALAAPAWALWLLWLLWRGVAALREDARRRAYGRWQGSYFEFEGRQVRVAFDDDGIFVAAADVFDALAIDARGRAPERVRLLAGREGLIERAGIDGGVFTERGLRAWMERRRDARALRLLRWFEDTVAGPRRRSRERAAAPLDTAATSGRQNDRQAGP